MKILEAYVSKGNPANITKVSDNWWRINEDLIYIVITSDCMVKHVVPKGFECDTASIPPQFLWLFGSKPYIMQTAGILHDYFYKNHGVNRDYADMVMLRLMEKYNNPKDNWKKQAIYWAVRAFGGKPWKTKS